MDVIKKSDSKKLPSNVCVKSDLSIGDEVKIKKFDSDSKFIGTIIRFLENHRAHNPNGTEVEIDNGMRGNTIQKITTEAISKETLLKKLKNHEGLQFELKASYYCDTEKTKYNPANDLICGQHMKNIVIAEICSFMNNPTGGILCIGIKDDLKFYGLENDFKLLLGNKYAKYEYLEKIDDFKGDLVNNVKDHLGEYTSPFDVQFLNFSKDEIQNAGFEIDETQKEHDQFDICIIELAYYEAMPVIFRDKVHFKNEDKKEKSGIIYKIWDRNAHGKNPLKIEDFMCRKKNVK